MKINAVLRAALMVDRNFDSGMDYFQSYEERYEQLKEDNDLETFTSGFKAIDSGLLAGGPTRGEMYSWVGLSGTGKSLALVRGSILNVTLGKRVVYISLEMDESKIAERFDAQLACVDINKLEENKEIIKKAMQEEVKGMDDPRMLIIKQFPAGQMDVSTLRAYIQQLKLRGFAPDLVIVDYIGEMKDYPNVKTHESRYMIVRDLRGFATEEDVCIFTAMQPNRSAREILNAKDRFGGTIQTDPVIDDDNLGDSFAQIRPLDGCWSINQTREEKKIDLARVFVIKHRHGKSRYTFHIEFHPETLAITQIEPKVYSEKMKMILHEAEVMASELPPPKSYNPDGKLGDKANDIVGKQFNDDAGYQDEGPDKPENPLGEDQ
jgi:KaiC/GvpD/RAD55 family RecA-like ATPase